MRAAAVALAATLSVALVAASCRSTSTPSEPTVPSTTPSAATSTSPGDSSPASPGAPHPGVRVDLHPKVKIDTYTVHGATPTAIFAEIQRRGPGPWAGEASWQISYDTAGDYTTAGGPCRLRRVVVNSEVTLTLPEWKAPSSASAATRGYWRRTSDTLERHERGHQQLVEAYSERLARDLAHIRTATSCAQLYDRGDRTADRAFAALNRANRRYDRITHHGLTQSAAA